MKNIDIYWPEGRFRRKDGKLIPDPKGIWERDGMSRDFFIELLDEIKKINARLDKLEGKV